MREIRQIKKEIIAVRLYMILTTVLVLLNAIGILALGVIVIKLVTL